ncbi:MAG TPA: LTA synthase family protein [Chthoniobacter sp.]
MTFSPVEPLDALDARSGSPCPTKAGASTFWPALLLEMVLFGTKVPRVWLPDYVDRWQLSRYFSELTMVTAADLLYALAFGLLGQALLLAAAKRPRLQWALWRGWVGLGALSVLFGILSVRIYDVLHMPLTFTLLKLGANLGNMRSSMEEYLTFGFLLTLILLPLGYLAAVAFCERFLRFPRRWPVRTSQAFGLAGIAAYGVVAHGLVESDWGRLTDMSRLWSNPHYVLISSTVRALLRHSSPSFDAKVPPAYLADFAPSESGTAITPGIPRGPRNVIVIVGESVGAEYLSLYGSKLKTWPRMEAEATHCLQFRNFYAHIANTANALFALTLSHYPPLTWTEATSEATRAPGTTVAQVLRRCDYRTAFISAGDNTFADQDKFIQDRGYDTVWDCQDAGAPMAFSWGVQDKAMIDMVLRYIDQDRSKPFYIFSWNQGTHHPYYLPPNIPRTDFLHGDRSYGDIPWELNKYLNSLVEFDRQLGRLFDALRERGLDRDTMVIVTGDHGQAFGAPHKGYYHSGNVYQEDVHVPLVVWSPALFHQPAFSDAIGSQIDLSPMILDLLGIPAPAGWQGRSPLDSSRSRRAYFFGMRNDYIYGVREGAFKYILNASQGRGELFNVLDDPDEHTDLSVSQPEISKTLRQRLAAWVEYDQRHPVKE